jgi:hypothetical protein
MKKTLIFVCLGLLSNLVEAELATLEKVSPHLHVAAAVGDASEPLESLVTGGHDPSDNFTVQGIEPGLSLRLHEQLEGFVTWNFSYGADEEWEDEFEEGFGKILNLPGGFELRGGRMLNRFGDRNAKHLHAWNTIDQHLVNGRFLGDDSLATDGVELTWYLPTDLDIALTVSYGDAVAHAHGHEDELHEDEDEHHEDEDGHVDDEHGEDEHGPDGEEILFEDSLLTTALVIQANRDDFNRYRFLAGLASGDNGLGDHTTVGNLGFEYIWRKNGLEAGGRQVRWMTEGMLRDFSAEADELSGDEFGFYTDVTYTTESQIDTGLRLGYVEGVAALDLEERLRISPYVRIPLLEDHDLQAVVQANFDKLETSEDAQGIWLQLAYSFGGKEVR